jgi:D-glutamate cyclase
VPKEHTVKLIAEAVDRLITVDVSSRGSIQVLYDAAREKLGKRPLTLSAAEAIRKVAAPEQPLVIATGLPIRGWFSPALAESDGPIGAATLARALVLAFKSLPVLICEEEQVPLLTACVRAAGLIPATFEQIRTAKKSPDALQDRMIPAAVIQGFPADERSAEEETERLLRLQPAALVSIERLGANARGAYHYARGEKVRTEAMAKVDHLFAEARSKGILTVCIGDGGNELGMGLIKEAVRKHVPYGEKCRCSCHGGLAPEFIPDVLVCATVSNWGAAGMEACLAALCGDANILHSAELEMNVIRACTDAGALDGLTGLVGSFVDTLPAKICADVVEILQAILQNGLNSSKP